MENIDTTQREALNKTLYEAAQNMCLTELFVESMETYRKQLNRNWFIFVCLLFILFGGYIVQLKSAYKSNTQTNENIHTIP